MGIISSLAVYLVQEKEGQLPEQRKWRRSRVLPFSYPFPALNLFDVFLYLFGLSFN
jgi:hypothetical protein